MFTGIVEEVGTVRVAEGGTLVIECQTILPGTSARRLHRGERRRPHSRKHGPGHQ